MPGPRHPTAFEKGVLVTLATVAAITAIVFVIRFHCDMIGNRKRLERTRETRFDPGSLAIWQAFDKPKHTDWKHGALFTAFLSVVLAAGCVLVWWLVYAA